MNGTVKECWSRDQEMSDLIPAGQMVKTVKGATTTTTRLDGVVEYTS